LVQHLLVEQVQANFGPPLARAVGLHHRAELNGAGAEGQRQGQQQGGTPGGGARPPTAAWLAGRLMGGRAAGHGVSAAPCGVARAPWAGGSVGACGRPSAYRRMGAFASPIAAAPTLVVIQAARYTFHTVKVETLLKALPVETPPADRAMVERA